MIEAIRKYLRELGGSNSWLEGICKSGYVKMRQAVVDCDTNALLLFRDKGYPIAENGENILHVAVSLANIEVTQVILNNFLDIRIEDKTKQGDTPLMLAVLSNSIELVQLLLKQGASINTRQNQGSTPVIAAAANGFVDILRLLVDQGANIDSRNFQGQTALHRACFYGQLSTVKYLVKNSSLRLSTCDKKGNNCVHLAAMGMSVRCIRYIMKKAKDQSIFQQRNQQSMTPLQILYLKFDSIRDREVPPISQASILQYLKNPSLPPPITLQEFNNSRNLMINNYDKISAHASEILEDTLNKSYNGQQDR